MLTRGWIVFAWILFLSGWMGQIQPTPEAVRIISPRPGDALQGTVTIAGSAKMAGFQMAEISFAYQDRPASWFLIQTLTQPVLDGPLAQWDTTQLTDGNYQLRLRVVFTGGQMVDVVVSSLRIRNYTMVETSTPTQKPVQTLALPTATATSIPLTPTVRLTPAPLAPNPVQVNAAHISQALSTGVLMTFLIMAVLGILIWLKRLTKRR
jgi:hypothetical protein